jgi:hypothetical protein
MKRTKQTSWVTREEVEYCQMTIVDHQGNILPTHPHVQIRQIWDGSEADEIIEHYTNDSADSSELFRVMNEMIFHTHIPANERKYAHPQPVDPIDESDAYHATIYDVCGTEHDLRSWARIFSDELIQESPHIGGDDSYYDYFPDHVNMFYQVCRELDLKMLYEYTLQRIKELRYHVDTVKSDPDDIEEANNILGGWPDDDDK